MAKTRRPLTDEERETRRAAQRELVRASIEQLRTSDGWQAYLKARHRFPSYSWRNVLLILHQRPTTTRVAGFRTWLNLGYGVRKRPDDVPEGAWAIRIWARCEPSRKRLQAWRDAGADPDERPRATYKLVSVFDRLSRVRSGDVADARGGLGGPPGSVSAVRARARVCGRGGGFGLRGRCGAGARRATAQQRSRARLAGTPENRAVTSRRRERRRRVPKPRISPTDRSRREAAALARGGARRPARAVVAACVRYRQRACRRHHCCCTACRMRLPGWPRAHRTRRWRALGRLVRVPR
jgi:hypothetical protein